MSYPYPTKNHQYGSRPSQHQKEPIYQPYGGAEQTYRAPNHSSYARSTTTVVEEQMQHKLPTMIRKLQQRALSHQSSEKTHGYHKYQNLYDRSDRELDEYLASNLQDFKRDLMNNIDNFQQIVLSAKPNPAKQREDPEGYRIHIEKYHELLQVANELVKRMQDSLNDILTRYQEHIDRLWTAICQGQDVRYTQRQFEEHMQQNMARYWKPIFDQADRLTAEIDLNFNQHSPRPILGVRSPR